MLVLLLIVTAIQAYVIGGINGAIITSKYFYKKDIRQYGSGNAGLTNFYRVFGKGGAIAVVIIDVVKTVAPVSIGGFRFRVSWMLIILLMSGFLIWPVRQRVCRFLCHALAIAFRCFTNSKAARALWRWARSCFLLTGA